MPKQITIEDARKKWRDYTNGFVKNPPIRTAVLGDGRGQAASNMYVPQSNNEVVWAREYMGDSKFFAVINHAKVVPAFDLPVKISYTFDELGQEQVIGINYAGAGGSLNVTTINALGPHHLQHEFGGGDEVYIDGLLFKPGLVYPTSPVSMQLQVSRFIYYWNSWNQFDTADTDSLAPFKPPSGFSRYVLIALDPETGTLVYRLGEPVNLTLAPFTTTAFSFSYVPAPSGNEIPLAYVALTSNTTTLDWTDVQNQIGDGRLHVGFPARNILERLDQVEGYIGNPPSLATTGAAASSVDDALTGRGDSNKMVFWAGQTSLSHTPEFTVESNSIQIGTTTASRFLSVHGEDAGVIVDSGGFSRVGFMKYSNREGGIWRTQEQDFEIGRVNVTNLGSPASVFNLDATFGATGSVTLNQGLTVASGISVGTTGSAGRGDMNLSGTVYVGASGTFTPAFKGTTFSGVFNYTAQGGTYFLYGNMVFVLAQLQIDSIGSAPTGNMTIIGLPFTSAAVATAFGAVTFGNISNFNYAAGALQLTGFVSVSNSAIILREAFDNSATVAVPAANFTNASTNIVFSAVYPTGF